MLLLEPLRSGANFGSTAGFNAYNRESVIFNIPMGDIPGIYTTIVTAVTIYRVIVVIFVTNEFVIKKYQLFSSKP